MDFTNKFEKSLRIGEDAIKLLNIESRNDERHCLLKSTYYMKQN